MFGGSDMRYYAESRGYRLLMFSITTWKAPERRDTRAQSLPRWRNEAGLRSSTSIQQHQSFTIYWSRGRFPFRWSRIAWQPCLASPAVAGFFGLRWLSGRATLPE